MAEDTETPRPRRRFRSLPGPVRWSTYVGVVVVLAIIAGLVAGVVVVRRSFPDASGTLEARGLESEVDVVRDEHGVPQIYADSMHDLMLAQGFVHAQERFFEMDVRRHATAGRLAEMFGEAGLESDMVVRTLGWRRVAEQELSLLEPETRDLLDAYAEGVNAYLSDRSPSQVSLEYTVLGLGGLDYTIEDWTAVDSVAWLKAMAWDLRGNLDDEIGRALSTAAVGEGRAADLYPSYPFQAHQPIVTQGAVVDDVFEQDAVTGGTRLPQRPPLGDGAAAALARTSGVVDAVPELLGRGDGVGSNGWVIGGERSETGAPILANDPHLGVSLPGVWMQVGLHCRNVDADCPMDVAGFSFSGVPGVVIGHNADIAWGFTNLGADVTDLYVERIEGDTWRSGRESLPLRSRSERIDVHGGDPVEITVRSTDHGPILSDLADDVGLGDNTEGVLDSGVVPTEGSWEYAVSLAWTALEPRPTMDALFELNTATGWQSFRSALSGFAVPGQNVVYADTEGHIGYQATGRVPIRKSGTQGLVPAAGWRPENDWTGQYVPFDALPRLLDPDSGVIVTANQAVIGPDYPYYLTEDWSRGYRSSRINGLVGGDETLGVEDMHQVQLDEEHPLRDVLVPYLLEPRLGNDYYRDAQELLRDWDGQASADSAAAAYFNAVWDQLLERTFHDELPEGLRPDGGQRWYAVVSNLLRDADAPWWDDVSTPSVEGRDQVIADAMRAARDELTARLSPNVDEWEWGQLHELDLRSATLGESGVDLVERMFNRGGWEVGGGTSLVNALAWDAAEGFEVTTGPSMRMVVDLDDLDASRWVNLTGVSGHAFHPHYTDQTDLFARGDNLPWAFSREAVDAAAEDTLTLQPE
ncbi:penicillin acylase family protein [Nocardioides panacisoli]|uniref:penicillin acylase family protein n=1 Tax=Nocardioides panacisoli TaxID=627624 RepID=UPI001C628B55|nr:penicillin acylase family protein [Nocardioides panacisoli]QYJ02823.1 penicillin acylase family protein [Nocardioides panacisoli]